jgi:hypothetical protein
VSVREGRSIAASIAVRVAALLLAVPAPEAMAQPSESLEPARGGAEGVELDDFVFPGLPRGLLRLELGSGFAPPADAGGSEVALAVPGARLRLQAPIGVRASVQAFAAFASSLYEVDHASELFEDCDACPAPDDFYSTSLGAQGALLLNDSRYLIRPGERWALVGEAYWRARFAQGAFERSLTTGTVIGLGYELPAKLRVAVGAQIDVALDGGEVSVRPTGAFRWDITPIWRLHNRGFGLELELRPMRRFELFASGYRSSDHFRLRSRSGLPAGANFRDRRWQVGAGFEWKLWRWLRLRGEAGAILDRRLAVRASGEGTLDSSGVDPSPYVDLRLELRP